MKIMQYRHSVVWQATCSMILIAATYATSPSTTESRQRRPHQQQTQAEVSEKQIPARPVKFGEKVALPNEVFLPTQQSMSRSSGQTGSQSRRQQTRGRNDVSAVPPAPQNGDRQRSGGQAPRRVEEKAVPNAMTGTARRPENQRGSLITEKFLPTHLPQENSIENPPNAPLISEHISLPTHPPPPNSHLSRRRSGGGTRSHQMVVQQYEIPVVQKTHETTQYKPITPTVGQQRQQQQPPPPSANANRSRFSTTNAEQPPTSYSQTDRAVATAAMRNIQQQQQQKTPHRQQQQSSSTLTARTNSHKNSQHSALSSSRNSNHNALSRNNNKSNSLNASYFNSINNNKLPSQQYLNGAGVGDRIPPKNLTTRVQQHRSPPPPATSGRSTNTRKSSTTTPRPLFSLPNEYNIFSPEFWRFLNPTTRAPHTTTPATTTTKRPPKKYIPPQQATLKEEKLNYSKAKPTFQPTKSTHIPEYKDNTSNKKDDGPFRIALPTFTILNPRRESVTETEKDKRDAEESEDLRSKFNCPRESEVRFQLFPKICKVDDDCRVWNRGEICCEIFGAKSCVSGIPKPLEETSHSPILGLIPRKCPDRPLAELWWEVKECDTDMDCWPRVCCPDGRRRYCRTSQPELNTVPVPVKRSFNYLTEYLECTAPPPPIFDLHPKACTSTLDCFPNVCCQEAGLRHCRPPKKSVLTMLANVFNVDLVKRLTQNIVIK